MWKSVCPDALAYRLIFIACVTPGMIGGVTEIRG